MCKIYKCIGLLISILSIFALSSCNNKLESYIVHYETNCDILLEDQIVYKGIYLVNPEIERYGFRFCYWSKDEDLNTGFSGMIFEDTILYAKWEPIVKSIKYSYQFDYSYGLNNNGSYSNYIIDIINSNYVKFPLIKTFDNYEFIGWFDEDDNEVEEGYTLKTNIFAKYESKKYTLNIKNPLGEDIILDDVPYGFPLYQAFDTNGHYSYNGKVIPTKKEGYCCTWYINEIKESEIKTKPFTEIFVESDLNLELIYAKIDDYENMISSSTNDLEQKFAIIPINKEEGYICYNYWLSYNNNILIPKYLYNYIKINENLLEVRYEYTLNSDIIHFNRYYFYSNDKWYISYEYALNSSEIFINLEDKIINNVYYNTTNYIYDHLNNKYTMVDIIYLEDIGFILKIFDQIYFINESTKIDDYYDCDILIKDELFKCLIKVDEFKKISIFCCENAYKYHCQTTIDNYKIIINGIKTLLVGENGIGYLCYSVDSSLYMFSDYLNITLSEDKKIITIEGYEDSFYEVNGYYQQFK